MAGRQLSIAAFALVAWTACKATNKGSGKTVAEVDRRCEQLAASCGDKDKHVDKILDACHAAATTQAGKGCGDQVITLYDCYEKELCGKGDKVWALDDFRVLAGRKNVCKSEHEALDACMGPSKGSAK